MTDKEREELDRRVARLILNLTIAFGFCVIGAFFIGFRSGCGT